MIWSEKKIQNGKEFFYIVRKVGIPDPGEPEYPQFFAENLPEAQSLEFLLNHSDQFDWFFKEK